MEKLKKIDELFKSLQGNNIRYCHWKSNLALDKSLLGQTDIDLLIDRKSAGIFRMALSQLCFRPTYQKGVGSFPSVEHYFSLDEDTGGLVHVHAYYRAITGESLAKNYRFPIEEMLLQNLRYVSDVPVPTQSAELVVFTLRMMLKHTSVMEILLLSRYWDDVQKEIKWLLEPEAIEKSGKLLQSWLPAIDKDLFSECVRALQSAEPLFRRIQLGLRLRRQLRPYRRHSAVAAWLVTVYKFFTMFLRRITRSQKGMILRNGGGIIAFVGSEATGKSTLISEMRGWLGKHFFVKQIHVGKPKSTILSFLPNIFLPLFRSIFPASRTTKVSTVIPDHKPAKKEGKTQAGFPFLFMVRSVFLAYDRFSLLTRAFRQAANGAIILCDRYPSETIGAPDSPQLSEMAAANNGFSFRRLLAQLESRMYRKMPTPDLIIYLSAPLEVTVSRNAARGKTEPEKYVRLRHAQSTNLDFGKIPVYEINTDQPLEKTVAEIKKALWNAL
jgi:thymidylate kinase